MPKISVDCSARVRIEVQITDDQLVALEAGIVDLDDLIDESVPYRELATEGHFELEDWELVEAADDPPPRDKTA